MIIVLSIPMASPSGVPDCCAVGIANTRLDPVKVCTQL
jgi:hypothetical protein